LAAAALLALATVAAINGLTADARAQAAAFGRLRAVPVAARSLDAGDEVGPEDVTTRRLPAALIPRGGVAARPEGRVVVVPVAAGEVLLEAKLAPWGLKGAAALLPDGTRALAIPVSEGTPPLSVGNHVDLLATFSPDQPAATSPDPSFPVAEDALVVAVGHDTVTVAVDQRAAPAVAYAIAAGTVIIALTSP
jgi:Flp pilus assembly protein CpaB